MIKIILFLLIYTNSNFTQSQPMHKANFQVLNYNEALELKETKKGIFIESIPFNNANVYELSDSTYLVMPLNPFSKALLVYDRKLLEEMKKTKHFPTNERLNSFYDKHKRVIENLDIHGNELLNDLNEYLQQKKFSFRNDLSDVDNVYSLLKSKNDLNKFRINFILFLFNKIVLKHDSTLRLGLLSEKQSLNPTVSIVLVNFVGQEIYYFEIEREVFGRSGYYGIQSIINSLSQFKKRVNEINSIDKIFNWNAPE